MIPPNAKTPRGRGAARRFQNLSFPRPLAGDRNFISGNFYVARALPQVNGRAAHYEQPTN